MKKFLAIVVFLCSIVCGTINGTVEAPKASINVMHTTSTTKWTFEEKYGKFTEKKNTKECKTYDEKGMLVDETTYWYRPGYEIFHSNGSNPLISTMPGSRYEEFIYRDSLYEVVYMGERNDRGQDKFVMKSNGIYITEKGQHVNSFPHRFYFLCKYNNKGDIIEDQGNTYTYQYNTQGKPIEKNRYYKSGRVVSNGLTGEYMELAGKLANKAIWKYDTLERLIKRSVYDYLGNLINDLSRAYSADDSMIKKSLSSEKLAWVNELSRVYGANNIIIEKTDKITQKMDPIYRSKVIDEEIESELAIYNKEEKLLKGETDSGVVECEYNNGKLAKSKCFRSPVDLDHPESSQITVCVYDTNENLITHYVYPPYDSATYKYDSNGDILEKEHWGEDRNLDDKTTYEYENREKYKKIIAIVYKHRINEFIPAGKIESEIFYW
ncbi:MAG: hypothetical protein WC614_04550 [bacterium]